MHLEELRMQNLYNMKIFISHIQEEFQVALVLKKWIQSAFADLCEVRVSTDPEHIPALAQYLEQNQQASLDAKALLILCSPNSVQRPWLSFEVGCAWMQKISIIPICYSGLSPAELPQPLATFTGFDLNQKDFPQKLFFTLSQKLGIPQLPSVQYRQMREELREIQAAILPGLITPPSASGEGAAAEPVLEPLHVQIMLVLSESYGYASAVLAEHFNLEEQKVIPLLKKLVDWNYVYASPAGMGHAKYNLTAKGKAYLKENGLT